MGRIIIFYLVPLVLGIYCLVEAISSRDDEVRNLPKIGWILLILFFPFVGSIAWLAAGRPAGVRTGRSPYEREVPQFPEYDRPGRAAALDPEADEAFLRKIRERAEEQRRKAAADQAEAQAEEQRRKAAADQEPDDTAK
ncbi:PLD nuclease N-terminal domain-containing protein [Nocardioides houyundeii]|uniref:PLD nuclease N-terminal domain-containing protein n=1 Tax=Nocardioides houyundeii TaxID=2045452 RepID=UPI000C777971|nr:PLD nuclease N-terminal domain-containing protein [Nocardioides houyundeii]